MNNRDIENFIKKEVRKETPDVLQGIKAQILLPRSYEEEEKIMVAENIAENIVEEKRVKTFNLKPVAAFLMVAVLVALGAFSLGRFGSAAFAAASVVEFDVNPSVEIKLNSKGRIIEAVPLNEDGKKILQDMDLKQADVNVGVNAIIGSMYKNGYISELQNSVLVSVQDRNKARGEKLKEDVTKQINETLASYSVEGAVVTQDFSNGDKTGKQEFIQKILDSGITTRNGEPYTQESLSQLNINELNVILNSKNKSAANTSSVGTASTKKYIGIEKAKSIALADAKVDAGAVRDLSIDLDYENGLMIYEVDFEVGANEYDYDINAVTGEIIKKKTDKDDDHVNTANNAAQNNSAAAAVNNAAANKANNQAKATPKTTAKTQAKAAPKTTAKTQAKAAPKTQAKPATQAASSNKISASQARSIALGNAGVSNPYDLDVEFDDGRWEVDFKANGKEYDYKISTAGKILSKNVEIDD